MKTATLRFGLNNCHSLVLTLLNEAVLGDDNHPDCIVQGEMFLKKTRGSQELPPIKFPRGMSVDDIVRAWEAQKSAWITLFENQLPVFVATRVIWLNDELCLMWNLVHFNETPNDTCNVVPMRRADWTYDRIVTTAMAQ